MIVFLFPTRIGLSPHINKFNIGTYRSNKKIDIGANDKIHWGSDCFFESIVIGTRQSSVFRVALIVMPGQRMNEIPKIKKNRKLTIFKIRNSRFCLEDDDKNVVDIRSDNAACTV